MAARVKLRQAAVHDLKRVFLSLGRCVQVRSRVGLGVGEWSGGRCALVCCMHACMQVCGFTSGGYVVASLPHCTREQPAIIMCAVNTSLLCMGLPDTCTATNNKKIAGMARGGGT